MASNPFSKSAYTTVRDQVGSKKTSSPRTRVETERGNWSATENGGTGAIERTALKAEGGGYSPFIDWEWVGCKSEKEFHRIQQESMAKRGLRQNVKEAFQRLESLGAELEQLEADVEGASDTAAGGGAPGGSTAAGAGEHSSEHSGTRLGGRVRDMARDLHDVADILQVKPKGVLRSRFDLMFGRLEKMRAKLGVRASVSGGGGAEPSSGGAMGGAAAEDAIETDSDDESFTDSISEMSYQAPSRAGHAEHLGAVRGGSDSDGSSGEG